jgi:hypothetical protein
MAHFGIPDKLIRLKKATMENSTYHVKRGTIMTDGFKVGNGLKHRAYVGPCHHGMERPQVADGGTASYMEGSCE